MRNNLTFIGWGLVGEPPTGVLVSGPSGPSLDVTGYNEADYWSAEQFRGPDDFGIVPLYRDDQGRLFPADGISYPHIS